MRTTYDLNSELVEEVMELSGESSKSKAIEKALNEYVRRIKIAELRAMIGQMPIDDLSEESKAADLRREQFLDSLRGDS